MVCIRLSSDIVICHAIDAVNLALGKTIIAEGNRVNLGGVINDNGKPRCNPLIVPVGSLTIE